MRKYVCIGPIFYLWWNTLKAKAACGWPYIALILSLKPFLVISVFYYNIALTLAFCSVRDEILPCQYIPWSWWYLPRSITCIGPGYRAPAGQGGDISRYVSRLILHSWSSLLLIGSVEHTSWTVWVDIKIATGGKPNKSTAILLALWKDSAVLACTMSCVTIDWNQSTSHHRGWNYLTWC